MPVITELHGSSTASRQLQQEDLFPIREVSRLTGVNPVTLRAWERRYGLIVPTRTESGHRLYSMTDIERVRSILHWIERGVAVSKIGRILAKNSSVHAYADAPGARQEYEQWQSRLRGALAAFDERHLERLYGQVFASYPVAVVFQDILLPLWKSLMQQPRGFGQASEWLMLDSFLRTRVSQRLLFLRGEQPHKILLSALTEPSYELELRVAALLLGNEQVEVRVLALGQPFDELTLLCERIKPQALVLFGNHAPAPEWPRRLNRLAMSLDCPLMLAGATADLLQESLAGTSIGRLGSEGPLMQRRLMRFLSGTLDT